MNLPLQLDRSAPIPLQDQLFEQLRQLIVTGRLKPNTRVIATRFLAEQTGVSRRTVLFAYERLIAEGYLETRPAIGTFVSATLPVSQSPAASLNGVTDVPRQAALHPPGGVPAPRDPGPQGRIRVDFCGGAGDASGALPAKVWLRWVRDVLDANPALFATAAPAAGMEPLRRVIADYLAATRGIVASAEQVIVVSGRLEAASLVTQLFQRLRVVVELPGEETMTALFRLRSEALTVAAVDEAGLNPAQLPQDPVDLLYVTPARQNPLGANLPPLRRTALIEWARTAGAYILEDDCDGELRYQGTPHPPLAAIDPYGLVFYTGSFAKVLGEGVNIGYLLAPVELAAPLIAIKAASRECGHAHEQAAVAGLIDSGEYDHHLRRLRKTCLERRDALIGALQARFGDVDLMGTASGTALTWLLPPGFPGARAICRAALARGIRLQAITGEGSVYDDRALVLDYGGLTPEAVREGVAAIAAAVQGLARA
jgi:GntR family transcriptional regulator/MocR family aminotransferase